jgi:hypothetical protein
LRADDLSDAGVDAIARRVAAAARELSAS